MKLLLSFRKGNTHHGRFVLFVKLFFGTVLAFSLFYNVSFAFSPSLTTARIAIIVFSLLCWKSLVMSLWVEFNRIHPKYYIMILFLLFYTMIIYFIGRTGDSIQLSRVFHYLVYSIVGGMLIAVFMEFNMRWVAICFVCATVIQTFFVILEMSNLQFHNWVVGTLSMASTNLDLLRQSRAIGLTNGLGTLLSVTQALGIFLSFLLLLGTNQSRVKLMLCLGIILLIISTFLSGRTGSLLIILFVFGYFLATNWRRKASFVIISSTIFGIVILQFDYLLTELIKLNPNIHYIVNWQGSLLSINESQSFKSLLNMNIPPLSLETFLGTGLVSEGGYNSAGSDSGYIQTYYSLGLFFAITFYVATLLLFVKAYLQVSNFNLRIYLFVGIIGMFLIELKEPFIFKYNYPMVLFAIMFCLQQRLYCTNFQSDHSACP